MPGLSGDFGTVTAGRQATPLYNALNVIDPFETGFAGASTNLMNAGGGNIVTVDNVQTMTNGSAWQNNSLRYASQNVSGFSGEVNYGLGGVAGNNSAGREVGATANYANGPLALLISFDGVKAIDDSNTYKTTLFGGTLNLAQFGLPVKTSLGYAINKGSDIVGGTNVDSTNLILGARIPFGASEVLASYIRKNDKTALNQDADQYAVGYTYALSKRTGLYSSLAFLRNTNGGTSQIGNASTVGNTTAAYGTKAIDFGIRHSF